MSATIIRGNALALPVADASVDLVVTSPPYFGLRSYQDGGEHYAGQIGAEATPAEFVDALIAATAEMVRVLKPSGSIWVNLGDKYAGAPSGPRQGMPDGATRKAEAHIFQTRRKVAPGAPTKSLLGIPWRYALRCIDDLGLILRAEVIWCLSGGARVYARTSTGDRPVMLRDLVRSYRPEDVQLWNGERWTQVLGWNRTPDDDGAIELELRTGERVGCTPGHKWPTQRGVIRADEIRVGDTIATTRLPEPDEPRTPAFLPDADIGWLVGLYIAEGSRSETTVQIAGHSKEVLRHERLARIAASLDATCNVYTTGENVASANLRGSALVGVIDRYVSPGTAKTKHLRHAAWQRGDEFLAAVVEGYLDGDGHFDAKNDRWRLGFCANDEWSSDLRTLAARLGAKFSLRRAVHTGSFGTFPGWRGEWRWTRSTHHNAKQDGEVVAIRKSRARDFYDLGVTDEPHLFALASGVLTHNSKPNGLPESVTDRVRRSHETWFHFTKEPRYFSSMDEIRDAYSPGTAARYAYGFRPASAVAAGQSSNGPTRADGGGPSATNPLGKLPGSVWTIPTQPLTVPASLGVDHFAAFPFEFPRRIIRGWSPRGVCVECHEGLRPITKKDGGRPVARAHRYLPGYSDPAGEGMRDQSYRIEGYECSCHKWTQALIASERTTASTTSSTRETTAAAAGSQPRFTAGATATTQSAASRTSITTGLSLATPTARPAVVLDPFGGTGTTALVAHALGRHGISVDMSADYCRLAKWRTTDPGQLAKARHEPPPVTQVEGQGNLFEGEESA